MEDSPSIPFPNPYHGFVFTTDGYRNQTPGTFVEVISPCEACSGYSLIASHPNVLAAGTGKLIIEPEPASAEKNASLVDCTFDLINFKYTPSLPQWSANSTGKYGAYVEITGSDNSTYDFFTLKWESSTTVGKGAYADEVLDAASWKGLKWLRVKTWAVYPNGTSPFAGDNYNAFGIDDLNVDKICKCKSGGSRGGHGGYGPGGKGGKGGNGEKEGCKESGTDMPWQRQNGGYIKKGMT